MMKLYIILFFFFFQAEDGIRDYKVTGVQTCALPISNAPAGTALTFTLYNDNACTSQVASQVVNVENVQVIELLRLLTPKGATPAPLTARLTTTLPWGAPVYLVRSIVSRSCRRAPSTSVSGRWRSR